MAEQEKPELLEFESPWSYQPGKVRVMRSAEDASREQVANRLRRHAAVAHDLVGAPVKSDDAVEDAGMLGGVELEQ